MDFKGHFALQSGGRCPPLTVLDDHSRFNLILHPFSNERGASVQQALTAAFATYENYLGQQLPVLWLPNTYNQISAIKTNLSGADQQSPLLFVNPESWSFTK